MDYCSESIIEYIRPYFASKKRNSGTFLASKTCTDTPITDNAWFVKWYVIKGGTTVLIEATPYYSFGHTYQKQYNFETDTIIVDWTSHSAYQTYEDISSLRIFECNKRVFADSGEYVKVSDIKDTTLPERFRPVYTTYVPCTYIDTSYTTHEGMLLIYTSGIMQVYNAQSQSVTDGWIRINASWMTNY